MTQRSKPTPLARIVPIVVGLAAVSGVAPAVAAQPPGPAYVGFVEAVYPANGRPDQAARIVHGTRSRSVAVSTALEAGDRIYMANPDATVIVRLIATRARVAVRRHGASGEPDYVATSPVAGLKGDAWSLIAAALRPADQSGGRDVGAMSRGAGEACFNTTGKTNEPLAFQLPVLTSEKTYLTAGDRSIFVAWRGGAAPFSVALTEAATGRVLARASGLARTCTAWLSHVPIKPGAQYTLSVKDVNGVAEEEGEIYGAPVAPSIPPPLAAAGLEPGARDLYYATWLSVSEHGAWAFEAQQKMAAIACRSPAARTWLEQYGDPPPC